MLPVISFLVAIQAVVIQALRDPVNQALTSWVPPPDAIKVQSVTNSGNGCPQGSINFAIAPNRTLLTYGFDNMFVYIGPGVEPSYKMKNCQIHTSLESRSQVASFAVATVAYRGLAILDPGVNLTVLGTWFLPDTTLSKQFSYTLNDTDQYEGNVLTFRADTNVPLEERVWTPCGDVGTFTLNVRARLQSANVTGSGEIMNDDQLMEGLLVYIGLDWRQCDKDLA